MGLNRRQILNRGYRQRMDLKIEFNLHMFLKVSM